MRENELQTVWKQHAATTAAYVRHSGVVMQ